MNKYVKSHGLGNDYIVLNQKELSFDLTPEAIRLICHRNYGIGSDGILLLTGSDNDSFDLRILNPDGSEAEKSGNGLRIFSKYLFEHGHTSEKSFHINTEGGKVRSDLETEQDLVKFVTVEMGKVTFTSNEIPVNGKEREVVDEEFRVNGDIYKITSLSVGNPHCVIFTDTLDVNHVKKVGPIIENHELFPNRINVQFAKITSPSTVEILIWERGAGYTLASGSSSCAVAAACVKNGLTESEVTIVMPGGNLDIEVRNDWTIKMRGPVEEVSAGEISRDMAGRLESRNYPNIPGL